MASSPTGAAGAWQPGSGGRLAFGHPAVLGRDLLSELARLLELDPAAPLSAPRERAEPVFVVEVASEAILDDLDTPADLTRLQARSPG